MYDAFVHEDMDICRQESRQARHICAVCFVQPYVHYAYVRRNACSMHVYKSISLYACVCICMYVCMYVRVCVCVCVYVRVHTYV